MSQLERIIYMESILDEASAVLASLTSLEQYTAIAEKVDKLEQYYTSPLWRSDFEDDCAGTLPSDLKRGVLSEDAVYNLLALRDELLQSI